MTAIGEMPITQVIDYKRSRLTRSFYFESDILNKLGLRYKCLIPIDFEMDWESVPFIKGTSKVAGLIHDYLCRIDSDPVRLLCRDISPLYMWSSNILLFSIYPPICIIVYHINIGVPWL